MIKYVEKITLKKYILSNFERIAVHRFDRIVIIIAPLLIVGILFFLNDDQMKNIALLLLVLYLSLLIAVPFSTYLFNKNYQKIKEIEYNLDDNGVGYTIGQKTYRVHFKYIKRIKILSHSIYFLLEKGELSFFLSKENKKVIEERLKSSVLSKLLS